MRWRGSWHDLAYAVAPQRDKKNACSLSSCWLCGNAPSGDEVFDLIIDKGTVDALMCMGVSGSDKGRRMVKVPDVLIFFLCALSSVCLCQRRLARQY